MTDLHGFELLQEQHIPELNTRARLFRHIKTRAELLSLENDDENKVFGIAFRTPPEDSTGIAHILEHSVLCGSRKYPLKEPFIELVKGSLKTFLNAFTYPDKTCYPVASVNTQDFYNLIDVYLDSVLYPRITPEIFQQEGWHYELESLDAPLTFKGVVFNEMKGANASPDRNLSVYSQQSIFPDTAYAVDSGGNPANIPDLTYEQFKAFHTNFYHPSNARFFFYGDDDPQERLRLLDNYLKDFEPIEPDSAIALQPRFDAPRQVTRTYAASQDGASAKKSMVTVGWMLDAVEDPETDLGLGILEHVLIGTPAAPLRKALIESGLGEDLTGAGVADHLRQVYFSVGLKGIDAADAEAVEELVLRTLNSLAEAGIDPQTIEASLNTVEFRLRENNTGSFPRGISLMLLSLKTWLHAGDPLTPLMFEAPLAAIKARLAAGERYFEGLIERFLVGNQHRVRLLLQPDPEQTQREAQTERERLEQVRAAMSEADLQAVIDNARRLKEMQETPDPPEALATIPSLKLDDMDHENKPIPLEVTERDGARILYHDLFTNGVIYLDVGLDLRTLPQELLPYVVLFGRALLEMGTEKEDYVQLSQRIGRATGGIWTQHLTSTVRETRDSVAWLFLRGKAMPERADEMLAILRDVLLTARLDNQERFRQIVLEEKAGQEAGLAPGGHSVVNARLRARFSEADWAAEQIGGVTYLFFLRQLAQQVDNDWPSVLAALERIRQTLVNRNALVCNVTLDAAGWSQFEPRLKRFLAELPAATGGSAIWTPQYRSRAEALTFPAQVNYVGKGTDLYRLGYRLHGSAIVITRYLRTTWLWERIRVQGGAYGAFCTFDHRSGVLSHLSYRDPNLLGTLDVYDQAGRFLRQADMSEAELTRSIIGAISDMDSYQLPDAKGYTSMVRYLVGDTDEFRQRIRDEVLATSAADFRAFADTLDLVRDHGQVVVLGSQAAVEKANVAREGWLEITKVL
jgi:Zn-dependent M16 (insulinase) family peptidase